MKNLPKNPVKTTSQKKVFLAASAFIIVLFASLIFAFLPPSAPEEFVKNSTVVYDENLLFSYEISRYPTSVEISSTQGENITLGFSLEPWNLNFGIVPTGGNLGKRFITLQNTAEEPAKVRLIAYGNISQMVDFSDNDFLLLKNAPKPLEIILETKKDTPLGNYSGEIDIIVKRAKYSFSE